MINNKLEAMQAADAALAQIDGGSSGLHGMYDASGQPTGINGGAVETLLVSVINDSFNTEDTAEAAMSNVHKWLHDMAREILSIAHGLPCGSDTPLEN